VDFATQTLYFWPPGDLIRAKIVLADFDQPLVALRDVSHVMLRGLALEYSLGNGAEMTGGSSNLIAGCTFQNLGGSGVLIKGGTGHGVRSSDFHDLGNGGIYPERRRPQDAGTGGALRRKQPPSPPRHSQKNICRCHSRGRVRRRRGGGCRVAHIFHPRLAARGRALRRQRPPLRV
jgi:hypothetical protein